MRQQLSASLVFAASLLALSACSGSTGSAGTQGPAGQQGAQGPQGPQGPQGGKGDTGTAGDSVVGVSLGLGDPDCPFGGSQFTALGVKTLACNGAPGVQGAPGPQGAQGPAGPVLFGTTAGVAAEGNDPRLSDLRSPLPGSDAYLRNGTASQVASFNITGGATIGGDTALGANLTVAGNLGIGRTPGASLDLGARADGLILPKGPTSARPASPAAGLVRFNTTFKQIEYYNGTFWFTLNGTASTVATGGTITDVGGYRVHVFTSSGVFTALQGLAVDVLVVGGGGAGGMHTTTNANGGGGGGGVVSQAGQAVAAGSITVTVGAGGAGVGAGSRVGPNGQNSAFGALVAIGGGGGGSTGAGPGQNGGSGGGGASLAYPAYGSATQPAAGGLGNRGGLGNYTWTGGGGGAAGTAGSDGLPCAGCLPGNGGRGFASDISGAIQYYGGGGGGAGNSSERAGDGWDGGGRGFGTTTYYAYNVYLREVNATTHGSGTPDAVPNTRGGGGGGSYWSPNVGWTSGSGAGGSGIVIVRYLLM
jgi:hypothetical protein